MPTTLLDAPVSELDQPAIRVEREVLRDRVVIRPAGEIDAATRPTVERLMSDVLAATNGPLLLELDLRDVTFIDSAGVELLLITRSQLARRDARLLLRPSPQVDRLLQLLGLRSVLAL